MINLRGRNEPVPEPPKPIIELKTFNPVNDTIPGEGVSGYLSFFPIPGLFPPINISGSYGPISWPTQ